jgi:hypothetical protein
MTVALSYVDSFGYVKFSVTGAPAGYTLKRLDPFSTTLQAIVGYEKSTWITGGAGYGEDYRPPLGTSVKYVLAPVAATADNPGYDYAYINTPSNVAWLRDITKPALSQRVIVVTTGDEQEPARQSIYDISGRHLPLVVFDVRQGRRGTLVLLITNYVDASGVQVRTGRDSRVAIERLLATGAPLLLTMCNSKVWTPCMMAIGNATFTRFGSRDTWTLSMDYVEVDDPLNYAITRIASPTWADHFNNTGGLAHAGDPPPPVVYSQLKARYANYLSVATGTRRD